MQVLQWIAVSLALYVMIGLIRFWLALRQVLGLYYHPYHVSDLDWAWVVFDSFLWPVAIYLGLHFWLVDIRFRYKQERSCEGRSAN